MHHLTLCRLRAYGTKRHRAHRTSMTLMKVAADLFVDDGLNGRSEAEEEGRCARQRACT